MSDEKFPPDEFTKCFTPQPRFSAHEYLLDLGFEPVRMRQYVHHDQECLAILVDDCQTCTATNPHIHFSPKAGQEQWLRERLDDPY